MNWQTDKWIIRNKSDEVRAISRVEWKPWKRPLNQIRNDEYLASFLQRYECWTEAWRVSNHYLRGRKTGEGKLKELEPVFMDTNAGMKEDVYIQETSNSMSGRTCDLSWIMLKPETEAVCWAQSTSCTMLSCMDITYTTMRS